MLKTMVSIIKDRSYLLSIILAALLTAVTFFIFRQYLVKNAGVWLAPVFISIYFYAIIIFVLNFILGLISYNRDKFLSYAFNFATSLVCILLLIAMALNILNPNG